jgi:hypothetical protein
VNYWDRMDYLRGRCRTLRATARMGGWPRRHRRLAAGQGRRRAHLGNSAVKTTPRDRSSHARRRRIPRYWPKWQHRDLAIKWLNGDAEAGSRVGETLRASGFSRADIAVHAITVMAVELERIDLQVERHESRRDSLLRQIERRREGWEKRVQRASEDVIEAEFREIATGDFKPAVTVGGSRSGK